MGEVGLWLRWTWRDLSARWVQVAAIALIIALGSGVYAGMSSSAVWRRANYDASYAALQVHDVRVSLAEDTYVDAGTLRAAAGAVEHPELLAAVEERLIVGTQVDASTAEEQILVPGRIVGVDATGGGPMIDRLHVRAGRGLDGADGATAVLDDHFAEHYELPPTGTVAISGGTEVAYAGLGFTPEYFMIASDQGSFLAEAGFAVLFTSIEDAQELTGHAGEVNDLVVTLAEDADAAEAARELEVALTAALPDAALSVTSIDDDRLYRMMYDDIEGDQRLFNIFAVLIMAGAAFAAFNLTGRIVEAQRREIGIGMSLGVPRWRLAVRPLLVGVEIALVGVLLGIGVGLVVGRVLSAVSEEFIPLPIWDAPFLPMVFARGILLGLVLTVVATIYPVWRAVRVDPIDAIRTGPAAAHQSRLVQLVGRLPLPGTSVWQLPVRNVARSPRRTALTALGIAAAIATLVAVIGMVDSFLATVDRGEREILGDTPDRIDVRLDFFYLEGSEQVAAISAIDGVAAADTTLAVGGRLGSGDDAFDVYLGVMDLDSAVWHPTIDEGVVEADEPSIVISQKAAEDLGADAGEVVPFRYPVREGVGYRFVDGEVRVAGIHPNPYRFLAYLDRSHAGMLGLEGIINVVSVVPERGADTDALVRALFEQPGVASVEPVDAAAQRIRDLIGEMVDYLNVVRGAVLLLALLIAFNSSSISADERARDHATMFAFGLPTRAVLAVSVAESFLVGVLGTAIGVTSGLVLLRWLITVLLPGTMPELTIDVEVTTATLATAGILGIVAVSLAPLLTLRKLRHMDISSTLRVVE